MRADGSRRRIAPVRQVVQLGALVLTGEWLVAGALRCPYGVPFMSCTSCPMQVCPGSWLQPWVIGFLVVSGVLVGRVFCGWACPMGAVQDLLGRFPKWRALSRPRFGAIDGWLKALKYPMLLLTVFAFFVVNQRFGFPIRGDSNFSPNAIQMAWLTYDPFSKARVVVLVSAVVLGLLLTRMWCRYLCPLGALLSISNWISLIRLRRVASRCKECGQYPRECRTYTTPGEADCVVCGDCIDGCSHEAVKFDRRYGRGGDARGEARPTPQLAAD